MKPLPRLAALVVLGAACMAATAHADPTELGRQIYLTGLRPDGSAVEAMVQQDVPIPPGNAACVQCHRRSGLGVWEGPMRAPPITGSVLFSPVTGAGIRPAYDADALRRAMLKGINAAGGAIDPLMPRYRLSDEDLAGLVAYLRSLDAVATPGVTDDTVELATIVAGDVDPERREAMLTVLQRYADIKNSGSRREEQRAAVAKRHPYGETRDRAFRRWHLSVWTLKGPPEAWAAQLSDYYEKNTPFVVLSGLADEGWPTVERFCEERRLPCILPITSVPADPTGFYTLHFTRGSRLQGWVTAEHLAKALGTSEASVMLVSRDDQAGGAARESFDRAWQALGRPAVTEVTLPPERRPSAAQWGSLLRRSRPDVLIAWLDSPSLQELASAAATATASPSRLYTAEAFGNWSETSAPEALRRRVWHVYPYRLAQPGLTQFPREDVWLTGQKLTDLDRLTAAQALFACHIVGEGLAMINENYSREYLIEQLEHALDGTDMTSLVPRTTFGPDQRFISRGAYITRLSTEASGPELVDAIWMQP
jgi:ABC-type branched-subunit amino acid transport system substrate-binding protein